VFIGGRILRGLHADAVTKGVENWNEGVRPLRINDLK